MIFVRLAISLYFLDFREYTMHLLYSHMITKLLAVINLNILLSMIIFLILYELFISIFDFFKVEIDTLRNLIFIMIFNYIIDLDLSSLSANSNILCGWVRA